MPLTLYCPILPEANSRVLLLRILSELYYLSPQRRRNSEASETSLTNKSNFLYQPLRLSKIYNCENASSQWEENRGKKLEKEVIASIQPFPARSTFQFPKTIGKPALNHKLLSFFFRNYL
jgi:hypothetical protein